MKRRFLRRLSALALAVLMAVSLCVPAWADAADSDPEPHISTELIVLEKVDDEATFTVTGLLTGDTVTPTATGNVEVKLESSDTDENGGRYDTFTVSIKDTKQRAEGSVEVRVTRDGVPKSFDRCYVYCRDDRNKTVPIQLNPVPTDSSSIAVGKTTQWTATIVPGAEDQLGKIKFRVAPFAPISSYATITEQSQNGNVCTAQIQGLENGRGRKATIQVISETWNCVLDAWEVDIKSPEASTAVTELYITDPSANTINLTVQETKKLSAAVLPSTATNKAVTWQSSAPDIVSVGEAKTEKVNGQDVSVVTITAKQKGEATITATSVDNPKATAQIKVVVKEAAPSMELSPTSVVIDTRTDKKTADITAQLFGENHGNASVTWTTNNPTVAAFDEKGSRTVTTSASVPIAVDGVAGHQAAVTIHGLKASPSPVTITATATFGTGNTAKRVTKTCSVLVIDDKTVMASEVKLSETKHTMPEDGSFTLTATVLPANAPVKTITWRSGNPNVATVDEKTGKVTGVKAGETTIIASALGGAEARCVLIVTPKTETIRLTGSFANQNTTANTYSYIFSNTGNDKFVVKATLSPNGAADPIRWTSEKENVATVKGTDTQAVIQAVGPGRTKITVVPLDPQGKDRANVTPAVVEVTVSGITLDSTALTLLQGRRQELIATAWGSASNGDNSCEWISSDPSIVSVSATSGPSTTLTARGPGKAVITAQKGSYTATCSVTVTEDTTGVIEGISTPPGVAYQFSGLVSQLQAACTAKTGAGLSYITNLAVASTEQGILHDKHYSADDTGAGVGIQDKYYPNANTAQGQRSLSDLSFVPRTTFSGTAEVNYTAWSTNNQNVNGVIRITVNGTGDVMYSGIAGSAIQFQASDFNRIHPNMRSVSFTLPQESTGVLYYNYISASQPGTRVTASDSYSRTGNPSLDNVYFVPAASYQGAAKIAYKGADTSGRSFSGTVTINVTRDAGSGAAVTDISYSVKEGSWVTFRPADFYNAARYALGEALSSVRFALPPSSEGTLFYNYRGFSDFDGTAAPTTDYYYSGTPGLGGISFVTTTTTPGKVDIPYTGYTAQGHTFTGTVHITRGSGSGGTGGQSGGATYTVFSGKTVSFLASDFNAACVAATGRTLSSVQFTGLPGVSQGNLRYTKGSSTTPYDVTTGTRFQYSGTGTANLIGKIYFQASANYTGTVSLPYTGTADNGATFTGAVTIAVTPPSASEIVYSGTSANPIGLAPSRVSSAVSGVLDGTLSYITFNNLPNVGAGKLYLGYSGFGTGTAVTTGTRYYVSATPRIDQISFVPRGRYTGPVAVSYTAVNTSGQSVSGRIMYNITSTGASGYFNDMANHTWAAPAVDYLYQNGVVKGTSATAFGPRLNIRRCDFVLMLARAFNIPQVSGYSFADVPTSAYYAKAVAGAKQMGIVSGSGANFNPNGSLTRQDAMVMVYNALKATGRNVPAASASVLNQFSDSSSVSTYARSAVSALVQMGAVNGSTSGRLNPRNPITRAEAAVILHFIMTM